MKKVAELVGLIALRRMMVGGEPGNLAGLEIACGQTDTGFLESMHIADLALPQALIPVADGLVPGRNE